MKITQTKSNGYTLITAENSAGMVLKLTSVGAGIREILVKDKFGDLKTVTLCPQNEEEYCQGYYGKTIGRTSGRIAGATFSINGRTANLEKNNCGEDNLHGGASGFHAAPFAFSVKENKEYCDVVFTYLSKDGEGGYFGTVDIAVTYRIFDKENTFKIIFEGTSDVPALLNMTNHVYLNMGGNLTENVREQTLYLNAPEVGRLNNRLIVEEVIPVPEEFDFTAPHKIGKYIAADNVQLYTKGYDHPFFLSTRGISDLACALQSEKSGIRLEVRTTYPCVVLYTDNYADTSREVYAGKNDEQYLAACLECQYHPDGIHQTPENCGVVTPEAPYREETEYRFEIIK